MRGAATAARALGLLAAAWLAGCAEFGVPPGGNAPPARGDRLQAVESRLEDLSRKVDDVALGGQGEMLTRIDAEMRALRGEVERLRFEFDASEKSSREQYQDLDRRLARIENEGRARLSLEPRLSAPPPLPSDHEEEAVYTAAFEQLRARQHGESIAGFRSLLTRWPTGRYADNARYWLGEAHYARREYGAALESFKALLAQFPDSPKVPDALFKVGLCQLELKQRNEARASWQRVVADHPKSSAAGLARERLEQLK
jgi:tol-pal system protein YbgF